MAVVKQWTTSQRVRVALFIRPRPLECRSRYFARLPFGTPQSKNQHLSNTERVRKKTCTRWYTSQASEAVSSDSPGIHRWLSEFRQAQ
jgi:hypothetical protein